MKKIFKNKCIILITFLLCGISHTYINASAMDSNINPQEAHNNLNTINNLTNTNAANNTNKQNNIRKYFIKEINEIRTKIKQNEEKGYISVVYNVDLILLNKLKNKLNSNTTPLDADDKERFKEEIEKLEKEIKTIEKKNKKETDINDISNIELDFDTILPYLIEIGQFEKASVYISYIKNILKTLESPYENVKEVSEEKIKNFEEKLRYEKNKKMEEIIKDLNLRYDFVKDNIDTVELKILEENVVNMYNIIKYNYLNLRIKEDIKEFHERVVKPFEAKINELKKLINMKRKIENIQNLLNLNYEKIPKMINSGNLNSATTIMEKLKNIVENYKQDLDENKINEFETKMEDFKKRISTQNKTKEEK